jgi:hypothetical protein
MLKASNEGRGTVAGLALLSKDLDDALIDGDSALHESSPFLVLQLTFYLLAGQTYALSPRHQKIDMSTDTYRLLAQMLRFRFPLTPVHCRMDRPLVAHSLPLHRHAIIFEYVILDGKRYYAS